MQLSNEYTIQFFINFFCFPNSFSFFYEYINETKFKSNDTQHAKTNETRKKFH